MDSVSAAALLSFALYSREVATAVAAARFTQTKTLYIKKIDIVSLQSQSKGTELQRWAPRGLVVCADAAGMSAVEDVHGLLQEPHFPNAVQWSADNLIAVASGASAVILNPCNLAGPRALLPTDGAGLERPPHSDLEPPEGHVLGQLLRLRGEGARGRPPAVRALAWGPAGSAPGGGCLLTALYDTGHVRHAGPRGLGPSGAADGWQLMSDLLHACSHVLALPGRPAAPPDQDRCALCRKPPRRES